MPHKPHPTTGRHKEHHIRIQIAHLRQRPRKISWIESHAQDTGYDSRFLDEVLTQFNVGGSIEQLRAHRKQPHMLLQIIHSWKVEQMVRATLVQLIIKSANQDFLKRVIECGWINQFAAKRLNSYCAKRNQQRTQPAKFKLRRVA